MIGKVFFSVTMFDFINDGIESALTQARDAAGDRDVRIAGGGDPILQYLNAGLIDEFPSHGQRPPKESHVPRPRPQLLDLARRLRHR